MTPRFYISIDHYSLISNSLIWVTLSTTLSFSPKTFDIKFINCERDPTFVAPPGVSFHLSTGGKYIKYDFDYFSQHRSCHCFVLKIIVHLNQIWNVTQYAIYTHKYPTVYITIYTALSRECTHIWAYRWKHIPRVDLHITMTFSCTHVNTDINTRRKKCESNCRLEKGIMGLWLDAD